MSRPPTMPTEQLDLLGGGPEAALADRSGLMDLLAQWTERGWLRPLDLALAEFLAEQDPEAEALVLLAAALASHQLGRGHVCLDLAATLADSRFALSLPPDGEFGETMPPLPQAVLGHLRPGQWAAAIQRSRLAAAGARGGGAARQDPAAPLVLDGERLYLRRYWRHEQEVAAALSRRLAQGQALRLALPPQRLRDMLDPLFPGARPAAAPVDGQKLACALMAGAAFGVVTGGPGTGKTTTVVKLLALLQSLALGGAAARPLRIRLAAPTGKAAARLNESLSNTVGGLQLGGLPGGEALRVHIPTEVTTLHRLLGSLPETRRFRHNRQQPLAIDVLVIDEASMVDLEMMAAVLEALPPAARLILLGDKDQLASVEAGAVLGELCARAEGGHYLPQTAAWLEAACRTALPAGPHGWVDPQGLPLDQGVAMLRRSYRFGADSGIGQLAAAVNAGDVPGVRAVLSAGHGDLAQCPLRAGDAASLRRLAVDGLGPAAAGAGPGAEGRRVGYRHYLSVLRQEQPGLDAPQADFDGWARQTLAAHGHFQLLSALRRGAWGVEGLNARIAQLLQAEGLIPAAQGWYLGRPVLVTRNDYGLGLMNGDIGITLALPAPPADGAAPRRWMLRVAFASGQAEGGIRWVLPSRLQAVETVYAMTVHKSQGSEFAHAALVLPDALTPVLTRELVYTGITRARQWFTLAAALKPGRHARLPGPVLEAAVARRVHRASGLGLALMEESGDPLHASGRP